MDYDRHGDPLTGWADVGSIRITGSCDGARSGEFTANLRHEFPALGLDARGPRIECTNGNAIDELEVFGSRVMTGTVITVH